MSDLLRSMQSNMSRPDELESGCYASAPPPPAAPSLSACAGARSARLEQAQEALTRGGARRILNLAYDCDEQEGPGISEIVPAPPPAPPARAAPPPPGAEALRPPPPAKKISLHPPPYEKGARSFFGRRFCARSAPTRGTRSCNGAAAPSSSPSRSDAAAFFPPPPLVPSGHAASFSPY